MGTFAITGSASGMGRATRDLLEADGHRVIGVDLRDAEVLADLATPEGRATMVEAVTAASGGALDGVVACAGVSGRTAPPALVVRLDYFGAVATLAGLRPLLAHGRGAAAVAIASNAATTMPGGVDEVLVGHCLAGDEDAAAARAGLAPVACYAAAKLALARWVRRHAVTDEWVGAGIRCNAVAPGVVVTAMTRDALPEILANPAVPRPTRVPGRPEEVASLIRYLLSPEGRYVVGAFLVIDGGTEAALRPDAWPASPARDVSGA